MYVAHVLYPVETLGPGQRIAVWLQGCSLRCAHCANPELWNRTKDTSISIERLAETLISVIKQRSVDGITFTGGEPFEQAEELVGLLELMRPYVADVLVFSGRTIEQLAKMLPASLWKRSQALIDVLIDGPYVNERNDNESALRGSDNQRILYLNPTAQEIYQPYLDRGRTLQNFYFDKTMLSIGIHDRED